MKISIVVPVFNEERTLVEILQRVRQQSLAGFTLEVIVVDDGSTDKTLSLLQNHSHLYDRLVAKPKNEGKGAAVRAALNVATGEYILFQDADLEYDPADYAKLFSALKEKNADLVLGSRFMSKDKMHGAYLWHTFGNHLISFLFNLRHGTNFTDIYTCYVLYRKSLVRPEELLTSGWEQQAELLTAVVRRGKIFAEVPISYAARSFAAGKKIRARHALAVIRTILFQK